MTISNELLDELLKGCERPEDLLGDAGLMKELKIRLTVSENRMDQVRYTEFQTLPSLVFPSEAYGY